MDRKQILKALVAVVLLAGPALVYAGVYKEGKIVSDRKSDIDIVKMKWGKLDDSTDRLIGTVRVFDRRVLLNPYGYSFSLTFDLSNKKGQPLDSVDTTFTFKSYGYKTKGRYVEGEFCVNIPRNDEAVKAGLVNVKIDASPAKYQTKFNISASLMRSSFALPEPKVLQNRR
jgi:hypothetical protein